MADAEKVVYELALDLPGFPNGEPVQIPGLGTFDNGSVYEVTEVEAQAYRTYHTRQVPTEDEDGNIVGATTELGPTLLQAFRRTEGVNVVTANDDEDEDPEEDNLDGNDNEEGDS